MCVVRRARERGHRLSGVLECVLVGGEKCGYSGLTPEHKQGLSFILRPCRLITQEVAGAHVTSVGTRRALVVER